MDFFQRQDVARKKTSQLVLLYIAAVAVIITSVYFALILTIHLVQESESTSSLSPFITGWWHENIFIGTCVVVLVIVIFGSTYKIAALASGGASVARALGGTLVPPNTVDPDLRKLLNVVEEMSIAAGTPVPEVYILDDERGINAFAAGYSVNDAVIGITRGSVQLLSRDELQGVIAHEFSHVLNGDMRLNIRLMGVLHGILVLGIIGYWMLRVGSGSSNSRRSSNDNDSSIAALAVFGALLMAIGYVGVFAAKLIKSAVSRQREYLADASAVQFTRQPDGIAGALKKIGGFAHGSTLVTPNAEEASHMFFSEGLGSMFSAMMATHPPLAERIKRIDPNFNYEFPHVSIEQTSDTMPGAAGLAPESKAPPSPAAPSQKRYKADPSEIIQRVGAPTEKHLSYAKALLSALPQEVRTRTHDPYGARALVYALLLDTNSKIRDKQLTRLSEHADALVFSETKELIPLIENLSAEYRLPLVDLSLPALKCLSKPQYQAFEKNVSHLVRADQKIQIFEYALVKIIHHSLDPFFSEKKISEEKFFSVGEVLNECHTALSGLARFGHSDTAHAAKAFQDASSMLHPNIDAELLSEEKTKLSDLHRALDKLAQSGPLVKRAFIAACIKCVSADGEISINEAELLRAICESLDSPLPPFLETD